MRETKRALMESFIIRSLPRLLIATAIRRSAMRHPDDGNRTHDSKLRFRGNRKMRLRDPFCVHGYELVGGTHAESKPWSANNHHWCCPGARCINRSGAQGSGTTG